jgi:transcriptional regulator with XRE-family HTH domain
MNNTTKRRKSRIISELLNEITPVEKMQASTKMTLAARIDDLLLKRGYGKSEFAEKMNKNPSEITKWLSGTQNFTIDTLSEIAVALEISITELFIPKQIQVLNEVHFVLSLQNAQPAVQYFTPFNQSSFGRFNTNAKSNRNFWPASASKIPA